MSKKDFKNINTGDLIPALSFISTEAEPEAPEVKTTKPPKKKPMPAKPPAQGDTKRETKSKRLNLLLQPSLLEDLSKLATMQKTSVNNLINTVLTDYKEAHKDIIDKYNSIFEG